MYAAIEMMEVRNTTADVAEENVLVTEQRARPVHKASVRRARALVMRAVVTDQVFGRIEMEREMAPLRVEQSRRPRPTRTPSSRWPRRQTLSSSVSRRCRSTGSRRPSAAGAGWSPGMASASTASTSTPQPVRAPLRQTTGHLTQGGDPVARRGAHS